jgi:zinc protease
MVNRYRWSVASLAVAAAFLFANVSAGRPSSGPDVSHFKLANGMEVVVIPDRRTPVVTHMVWYRVGSADEPPGKSGIAHFLEHLMFKGTEKNPAGRFSKVLATIGGQENAFTSTDYTGYFQRVTRDRLKMVMEFEADRMTGLKLTDAVVLPERNVVLEEQNSRVANSPAAKLGEDVIAALFLNHPYGRPVIGWRHEIEKLDRQDAIDFYNRFYTPNNAILVVAGDVSADEVRTLAEETYGKIAPRAEIGPRKRPQEPEQRTVRTVTFADPRVTQPSLQRSYLVPSSATAKAGESEALEVLSQILGSGTNSRFYSKLVIEKPMATSIGAWYQGSALDHTRFGIYGTPRADVTLKDLEEAMDGVIADIAESGVTNDELERAKIKLVADVVYAQDSQATMARWYGGALTTGLTVEHLKTWPDRIQKVTAEQIRDAAKTWLDKRRSVTGYLVKEHPKPQERRS